MLKRGVPLKLALLGASSVGRYFPDQCRVQVDDARHSIVMTASGSGYATLPVARRVGFYSSIAVEYVPDFRLEDDSMYVWGKFSRMVVPPELRILGVESPAVNLATQTPMGNVATLLGQGIVTSEIGKGFTVVRQDDGDDFTLGILQPPQKPIRQFKPGEGRTLLASDFTEIHAASRDYLGPFEVPGDGQALFLRSKGQGTPFYYSVVDRRTGDAWRQVYQTGTPLAAPPGPMLGSGQIPVGDVQTTIAVPRGSFYIVVENQTPMPFSPLGVSIPLTEPVSYLSYSVELGDRK